MTVIEDKLADKVATANHRAILEFMGDKKNRDPDSKGASVLQTGVTQPEFRDEIYLQLIKQCTDNPKPESLERGWDLMALVVSSFVVQDEALENLVLMFLRQAPGDSAQQYISAYHTTKYGEKPARAPSGSAIPGLVDAFKANHERSRLSVFPK